MNENRAKQALSPQHFASDTDMHFVTERMYRLVCQAPFQSSLSLLDPVRDMADIPQKGPKLAA